METGRQKLNRRGRSMSTRRVDKMKEGYFLSKEKKRKECASDLNDRKHQNKIFE